ncbi:MAG: DUF370 domain-containing protein [Firmicutes bacterium HGW-Firmicutes-14]|jgi:hypothetical protein|nr:MAG: DUF370 domain-containing protein [Firmicutes bacterium HGW-Firmicutes-14]
MFIHLGGDTVVHKEEVIAILSSKLLKKSEINREFIEVAKEDGFIEEIAEKNNFKSFIITTKKVYLSPISSLTLKKRSDEMLKKFLAE